MPTPLVFLPCERVIIEQASNAISVINIFQELTPSGTIESIPEDAKAPIVWYVFSQWFIGDEEPGQAFEQLVELEGPQGKKHVTVQTEFVFSDAKDHYRIILTVNGFPVGTIGRYHLHLSVRAAGETEWTRVRSYPMLVKPLVTQAQTVNPQ